jgi:hypothetical protein
MRAASMIVPQTAAEPRPIKIIAARKPTESNSPSSSIYARAITEITIAGTRLLKGTGVSSRTTVNNRTMTPTARFAEASCRRLAASNLAKVGVGVAA